MIGQNFGKWLIIAGLILVVLGALIWIAGKSGLPFGKLPGDINIKRDGGTFQFPFVTCIIVSIVLTALLNLIFRLFR